MTIRHLAYRLAHGSQMGIESLAAAMGKGTQVLLNKLNPNTESHHLTIAELDMLADFVNGNAALAEWFATKANSVLIALPDEIERGDMGLLDLFMSAGEASGTFDYKFKKAWADGKITHGEFDELKQAHLKLVGTRMAIMAEIERLM